MSVARRAFVGALLLVVLVALVALGWVVHFLGTPARPADAEPLVVRIEKGMSARAAARTLEAAGAITDAWAFERLLAWRGAARELRSGDYEIPGGLTPIEVMDKLVEGRIVTVPVTIPEGLDVRETASVVAAAGLADEASLLAAFGDASYVAAFDEDARDLEGYLFPETYRFATDVSAEDVAAELVDHFVERFLEPYADAIEQSEYDAREIATIASLVEEETAVPDERRRIAGVYVERLHRGMKLQCDPTIIYALKLEGEWDGDIRRRHLSWDHPYNTYVHEGLPPGPIASAGIESLVAVLDPVRDGSIFFVHKGDGSHHFSKTLREHTNAVRRYILGRR